MYVLNNISNFYQAYKNKEEIYYGKQLNFIPKRENFIESSRPIFDLIIQYAENAEIIDYRSTYSRYTYDNYFKKLQLYIKSCNKNLQRSIKSRRKNLHIKLKSCIIYIRGG